MLFSNLIPSKSKGHRKEIPRELVNAERPNTNHRTQGIQDIEGSVAPGNHQNEIQTTMEPNAQK